MKHLPIRPLIAATALAAAATAAATQPFPLPVSLRPTADEFGRLTVLNANNDAKQWQYDEDEQCIFYAYSSTKDADDWVFVPVELTAGHSWLKVSVEALATGASGWYDENFELALGESPDAASMRTVLEQTVDSDEFMLYGTEFPNSISGTAWLGIHATSPKNRRTLKVRDITLQSYSTPIPLAPAIKASATDGLCYTATVTMPSLTVQGSAIEGDLNLRFSIDGEEHETYAALAPGSDVAVEATLAKGEHTLAFVAVLATGGETAESEAATETAVARDLDAHYTLPFLFGPSGQAEFDECRLTDANGDDTTWEFSTDGGEPSFFYPYHSRNQADDWLFLPAVDFGTADKARISVEARSKGTYTESFEVWLGREASPGSMTVKAIDVPEISNSDPWTAYEAETTPGGGIWHVGIHATSQADQYGLYIRNVGIEAPDGPLTGIEEAGIDAESPAEWFDLQGMRLAAPEKGRIVIVRQGGKIRKTVF